MDQDYDLIVVGTGFASSFFLSVYLARCRADARILVLERGRRDTHAWQLRHRRPASTVSPSHLCQPPPPQTVVLHAGLGRRLQLLVGGDAAHDAQ